MKILFIAPYVPSLVRVRPYHLIRGLAALGHRVHVIAQMTQARERDEARILSRIDNVTVTTVELPRGRPWLNCARALPAGEPLWAAYGRDPKFTAAIEQALNQIAPDVVQVEHVRALTWSPLLKELCARPKRPALVFDAVDCISGLLAQYAERSPGLLRKLLYRREAEKMRVFEPAAARLFDRVIITSAAEREMLADLMGEAGSKVEVVRNGVDLEYFAPSEAQGEADTILFSGKMSFYNNAEAARYFVREIFPRIKAQRPAARVILAGADPPADLMALKRRGEIEVTGYVDDLRPYLRRAAVVVCPMLTAVGIQNKVLEAMALGKAVVATPLVAAGLEVTDGREMVLADGKDAFAQAVVKLLEDPEARQGLGRRAREYVERNHCWADSTRQLVQIYEYETAACAR